ncbi:MAG: hypothetical protein WBD28_01300 [Candidatus Zixiibacteriota bacterium]
MPDERVVDRSPDLSTKVTCQVRGPGKHCRLNRVGVKFNFTQDFLNIYLTLGNSHIINPAERKIPIVTVKGFIVLVASCWADLLK